MFLQPHKDKITYARGSNHPYAIIYFNFCRRRPSANRASFTSQNQIWDMTLNMILCRGVMVQGEVDPLVVGVMPMRNAGDLIPLRITLGLDVDVVVVEVLFLVVRVMSMRNARDLIQISIVVGLDVVDVDALFVDLDPPVSQLTPTSNRASSPAKASPCATESSFC